MKFFIDTALTEEILAAKATGLLDGVTTNPTLIKKAGRPFEVVIKEIAALVDGPVNAEVLALDAPGMVEEGRKYAAWAPNIVIKVPMTIEGLKAVRTLAGLGIKTNVTLIFQPLQALMAAKAGASYVSPFLGRLDDIATPGMALVTNILNIFGNYGIATEIIAASLRHPMHVLDCALTGAHIATIPWNVLSGLAKHPLTASGIEKFLADAQG